MLCFQFCLEWPGALFYFLLTRMLSHGRVDNTQTYQSTPCRHIYDRHLGISMSVVHTQTLHVWDTWQLTNNSTSNVAQQYHKKIVSIRHICHSMIGLTYIYITNWDSDWVKLCQHVNRSTRTVPCSSLDLTSPLYRERLNTREGWSVVSGCCIF